MNATSGFFETVASPLLITPSSTPELETGVTAAVVIRTGCRPAATTTRAPTTEHATATPIEVRIFMRRQRCPSQPGNEILVT